MRVISTARRGFTLVELSIVLVIIGLIIGGVLTGQQIILNARITNAINAIQSYQSQFQTYSQNYGALPGDDSTASSRFPSTLVFANGGGDGAIGTTSSFNATVATAGNGPGESRLVWSHMRAAGLIKNQVGSTGNAIQPPNPFSGIYGFQNGAFTGASAFTTTVLCLNNVPADAAQTIDTRLDDGQTDTGTIRATSGTVDSAADASTSTTTGYVAGATYTLCVRM
jgi:prepilin-type N-terminal cleavage/methylation domain-containing protein